MAALPTLFWPILAGGIALAGVALAAWALLWDRSRGRARCPKCWYDLSGLVLIGGTGLRPVGTPSADTEQHPTCPECGRKIRSLKHLHRTRRRWRLLWPAAAVFVVASLVNSTPRIAARGWPGAIPTTVLAVITPWMTDEWFGDAQEWDWNRKPSGARRLLAEFRARSSDRSYHRYPRVYWAEYFLLISIRARALVTFGQVRGAVRDSTDPATVIRVHPTEALKRLVLRREGLEQGQFSEGTGSWEGIGPEPKWRVGASEYNAELRAECVEGLATIAGNLIRTESWADWGGTGASAWSVAGQLLVRATPETHAEISRLFDAIVRSDWTTSRGFVNAGQTVLGGRITVVYEIEPLIDACRLRGGYNWNDDAVVDELWTAVGYHIGPNTWEDLGGNSSKASFWADRVIVQTAWANHQRIDVLLRALLQADHERRPEVLFRDVPALRSTTVYDLRSSLRSNLPPGPPAPSPDHWPETAEWVRNDPGAREAERMHRIKELLVEQIGGRINPYGITPDEADADPWIVNQFDGRLIVTVSEDRHEIIRAVLADLAARAHELPHPLDAEPAAEEAAAP